MQCSITVSYTHLDVYKRQGYYDVEKQMVIHIYARAAVLFHVYYGLRLLERIGNVFSFGAYGAYGADAAAANPGFFHT